MVRLRARRRGLGRWTPYRQNVASSAPAPWYRNCDFTWATSPLGLSMRVEEANRDSRYVLALKYSFISNNRHITVA